MAIEVPKNATVLFGGRDHHIPKLKMIIESRDVEIRGLRGQINDLSKQVADLLLKNDELKKSNKFYKDRCSTLKQKAQGATREADQSA